MVFPILGGNSAGEEQYLIDNSLRINEADSAYLSRTFSSAGNRKTFTWSGWIKKGNNDDSGYQSIFTAVALASTSADGLFLYQNKIHISWDYDDSGQSIRSTALFRDTSAWYHIVYAVDTTLSTASERLRVYVNGVEVALDATVGQNEEGGINRNDSHNIGRWFDGGSTNHLFNGYMAECHFIDGSQKSPTDFGEFDENSGIWKPIEYSGSYGTNGFYLDFENSGSLGTDQSGNGNNFTPTNLASTDQTTDTPTNNFATANYLTARYGASDIKEGNLILDAGGDIIANSTQGFSSGKWYVEMKSTITAGHGNRKWVGIISGDSDYRNPRNVSPSSPYIGVGVNLRTGDVYKDASELSLNINTFADGDIASLFYDADNGYLYVAKNGTLENSGNPVNNGSPLDTSLIYNFHFNQDGGGSNNGELFLNFGNAPTGYTISSGNADANGYGNFEYNPVISSTNYLALCTQNLATALSPTIDDGSQYFNTVLYSGNSGANSVTGVGFQPDFLWIKSRNASENHVLFNSNVGAGSQLRSNTTGAETSSAYIDSFDTDGFSMNTTLKDTNFSSYNYVSWSWLANGGTTSSNTDGSITSTVQANTTAGFSIITYTGNGTNGATVGHGLGKVPDIVLTKNRSNSGYHWLMYHSANTSAPETDTLFLNLTNATSDSEFWWNDTAPTSSVFSLSVNGGNNDSGNTYVAYCFNNVEGYSKFGSYTGNGNADGTFVYTGFRPAFVLIKRTTGTEDWFIYDSVRDTFNAVDSYLKPNTSGAEATASYGDLLSNGFKARNTFAALNASGEPYIYMAFAENPFVSSSGVPVVAR